MMNAKKPNETLMLIIWTQTLLALFGSLYFSEIKGFTPCELCCIQRILMYPLVIIYGVALIKKDFNIAIPGAILSGIGMCVSVYHYLLQKVPAFQSGGNYCGIVPCNAEYVNYAGFITIPFLAGLAFLIIFVIHIILWKQVRGENQ